jgi:hypothetical protein
MACMSIERRSNFLLPDMQRYRRRTEHIAHYLVGESGEKGDAMELD